MDVSLTRRAFLAASLLTAAGCMNPGYQTLYPPGFSNTALRVERHRRHLSDAEYAQLIGRPPLQTPLNDPAKAQMAKRNSHPGSNWNKGYEYLAKAQQETPAARTQSESEPQATSTANTRERPIFTGWRELGADTRLR